MTAAVLGPAAPPDAPPADVAALLARSAWPARLVLDEAARDRLAGSRERLARYAARRPVYGISRGYGPLVEHPADPDPVRQAAGLLAHLAAGQGAPLAPEHVRTMIWIRLTGMTLGHSGVDPALWEQLAAQWNAGFTPVVPAEGSLSASGDLIPLAHAALAAAGQGEACSRVGGELVREPAAAALSRLGLAPVTWEARSALAFVNGTSAALGVTLHQHAELSALCRAVAEATGRLVALLGASGEPYADALAAVRGHPGHRQAAGWIRQAIGRRPRTDLPRPLQEPYALRCAPQVLGAVLDQLRLQGEVLVTEALGCTDNPVLAGDDVLHGGNFHAAPVALAAEQLVLGTHQVAYLAERQLALVLDPARNGDRPPFLTPEPGRGSGFAGVQMAATSMLAAIRQHGYPASMTPVPSNLGNQDHVPMALNSAVALAGMLDRAWRITASLCLAVNQLDHLDRGNAQPAVPTGGGAGGFWERLRADVSPLTGDRPLAAEVRHAAALLRGRPSSVHSADRGDQT